MHREQRLIQLIWVSGVKRCLVGVDAADAPTALGIDDNEHIILKTNSEWYLASVTMGSRYTGDRFMIHGV